MNISPLLLLLIFPTSSFAQEGPLPIESAYREEPEVLVTEDLWELEPWEPNPHLRGWALQRKVELQALEAVLRLDKNSKPESQEYSPRASRISQVIRSHFRKNSFYNGLNEFPCGSHPKGWFQTAEGARLAALRAKEIWEEKLNERVARFSIQLKTVSEAQQETTLFHAKKLFKQFIQETDEIWQTEGLRSVRAFEWQVYHKQATQAGICPRKNDKSVKPASDFPNLEKESNTEIPLKPLVRAPARIWNGLFSVRLGFQMGERRLIGQFILHPQVRENRISEEWLRNQGAPFGIIALLNQSQQPLILTPIEMSGYLLPPVEFSKGKTLFFDLPESFTTCCDGVLGQEFLRRYVIRFSPDPPIHVLLYDRKGYSEAGVSMPVAWEEGKMHLLGCEMTRETAPKLKSALQVDFQQVKSLVGQKGNYRLQCDQQEILSGFPAQVGVFKKRNDETMILGTGFIVKGPFTFDFSRGRLILSQENIKNPPFVNRFGLESRYLLNKGQRVLKVEGIDERAFTARQFREQKLRPGMMITRVNESAADEIDDFTLQKVFSFETDAPVRLEWMDQGLKTHSAEFKTHDKPAPVK